MSASRIFAVGDIHGHKKLLDNILDQLFFDEHLDLSVDKLIFMGDMVDRGPNSYGVICKVKELVETYPDNVIALAGNHEWMNIMRYARGTPDDIELCENNGGIDTLMSYQVAGFSSITQEHLKWMSNLPFRHEEPGFFFSHAPAPRDSYRNIMNRGLDFTADELTWSYHPDERGLARDHGNGIVGVCGHLHAVRKGILKPRLYDHYIFTDAGCGCHLKAPLCAVEVKSRKILYAYP